MRARLAGVVAGMAMLLTPPAVVADPAGTPEEQFADVCLEVDAGLLSQDDWASVAAAVEQAVAERPALFPAPQLDEASSRLDVASGHQPAATGNAGCLDPGTEWTARFGRDFLQLGAEQMLEEAPTTPGIDSDVVIDWYPEETRLRTILNFAGPLDIPNGTCWIDDVLSVDAATGAVVASGEEGVKTSPFAEPACGRFFDHLDAGGAGEQAVTLLPQSVTLADGSELRFVAEDVLVTEDSVALSGRLERS